jgi:hypothetical protein
LLLYWCWLALLVQVRRQRMLLKVTAAEQGHQCWQLGLMAGPVSINRTNKQAMTFSCHYQRLTMLQCSAC